MQHRNNCNWTFRTRRPSSTVEPYGAETYSYNLFLCCVYSARQKPISCSYHCVAMSLCDIILCNNGISHNIHLCMNVYVRMYIHTYMYMYVCTCTVAVSRPVQLERYAFNLLLCWLHSLHSPSLFRCLPSGQVPSWYEQPPSCERSAGRSDHPPHTVPLGTSGVHKEGGKTL